MKVWIMETGAYEDRCVSHVIAAPTDAPAVLERSHAEYQAKHGPITIGEVEQDSHGDYAITATYPGGLKTIYDITEWAVETADTAT